MPGMLNNVFKHSLETYSMADMDSDQGLKHSKDNFSDWYNELVVKAGLADYAPIAGCMVIKPYGYAVWEAIQEWFNVELKATGHRNAYFPLLIPEKFLKREAEHFKGFTPEVAWVEDGNERYAIRPTSETIINDAFSKWIRSWRDLPMKINQWCNILRWETKATRLFLRTREFLWQEGHTAHRTKKEAEEEMYQMLKIYRRLSEELLAVPVLDGEKTEKERFAGADITTTIEGLMPDGRALQMGTSHLLGQNFSKPFNIRFVDRDEKEKHVWQTSWGFSTRLLGALVMVHGDDKGLVMPPRVAPVQVVIVPILFDKSKHDVMKTVESVNKQLHGLRVKVDSRQEYTPGWKFNEYEMLGVPIRIEVGPMDVKKNQAVVVRRDNGKKQAIKIGALGPLVSDTLEDMQREMLHKARLTMKGMTVEAKDFTALRKAIESKRMARIGWCNSRQCEDRIQEETAATIRLLPFRKEDRIAKCSVCGKAAKTVVYVAKQY